MSTNKITSVTINVPADKAIQIVNSGKVDLSFTMVGNGAINRRSGMKSIDILTMMEDMTTSEIKALNKIRTNLSWDLDPETGENYTLGIAYLPANRFTDSERRAFQKGVKLLKGKDLVKKVGRNDYMLNPRAIIPTRVKTAIKVFDEH